MQEFIQHLIDKTGISPDQANSVIHAIKEFVNQKAPMMSGAVDKLLDGDAAGTPGDMTAGMQGKLEEGLGGLTGKLGGFFGK